jgi:hypothetical protein
VMTLIFCKECREPVDATWTGDDFIESLSFNKTGHHSGMYHPSYDFRFIDDGLLVVYGERRYPWRRVFL